MISEKIKRLTRLMAECISGLLFAAGITVTAACLYIGISESLSGRMTFLFGYKLVYIESGSMEPAIKSRSFIMLKEAGYDEVDEGDIITFETPKGYVTHRLIGVDEEKRQSGSRKYLITKGDANNIADMERLNPDNIRGIYVSLFGDKPAKE